MNIFLLLVSVVQFTFAIDRFYFEEKDTPNRTVAYIATCIDKSCTLEYRSISNSKSAMKCGLDTGILFSDETAVKAGDTWTITLSSGACGYTNTYIISKSGMTQVKTSPQQKKLPLCEVFPPKNYQMERKEKINDIQFPSEGCKTIQYLSS